MEIMPWTRQPVWACLHVADFESLPSPYGDRKCLVTFEARTGPTTGTAWRLRVSEHYVQWLMRQAGAAKFESWHESDFGGLWFDAFLAVDDSSLKFENIAPSSSQTNRNRKLLKLRREICANDSRLKLAKDKRADPKTFVYRFHKGVCQNCPLGRDKCERSRHLENYSTLQQCRNYFYDTKGVKLIHHGWMTPNGQGICLHCLNYRSIRSEVLTEIKNEGRRSHGAPAQSPGVRPEVQRWRECSARAWQSRVRECPPGHSPVRAPAGPGGDAADDGGVQGRPGGDQGPGHDPGHDVGGVC
jgi:hypothetical protein